MKIYPAEIECGISQEVSKASVLFEIPITKSKTVKARTINDLYNITSVLATTGWNRNDDVLDKKEAYEAYSSILNKKLNYNHDELTIIGHIDNAYCINVDTVSEDLTFTSSDFNPEFDFHIITDGYLYTYWEKDERKEMMTQLLSEIEDGEWFVSMEAYFENFDYALKRDGRDYILERNDNTAFLTKKLRWYGGDGEYEGYKVGRLLRGITFVGCGLVKKPGNPTSFILDIEPFDNKNKIILENLSKSCVYENKENDMSEELKKAEARIQELEAQLAEKVSDESNAKISTLEKSVANLSAKLETAQASISTKDAELTKSQEALTEIKSRLEDTVKSLKSAQAEKEDMLLKAAINKKAIALVGVGVPEDEAVKQAEKLVSVDEDVFESYAEAMKIKYGKKTKAEAETVLEDAEPTEDTVPVVEEDEVENLQTAMAADFSQIFKNSKGDK